MLSILDGELVETIRGILKLFENRSLIKRMVYKEMTDRYAGSVFGMLWTIIQPLFLIALYALVFTFIFKVRINTDDSPIKYAFYAIAGLLPWIAFADAFSKSATAVSGKSPLIKQAIFPVEILPLSSVATSFIPLVVGLIIYIISSSILFPSQIGLTILILPIVLIIHFIFMSGIAYFLAIIGVYFRDLTEVISLLLTIGMFTTPILYLEQSIPKAFALPMKLNLVSHLIYIYRDAIFYGQIRHPWSFVIVTIVGILLFILGFNCFRKIKHLFANVL